MLKCKKTIVRKKLNELTTKINKGKIKMKEM